MVNALDELAWASFLNFMLDTDASITDADIPRMRDEFMSGLHGEQRSGKEPVAWVETMRGQKVARDADMRGQGVCRTCLAPIWDEGGTVGHRRRETGWRDRIERGGDSLVCFSAVEYRHVPLRGREAAIYDAAFARGLGTREADR